MSDARTNLLPEEIQAILEMLPSRSAAAHAGGDVAARDFARPLRMSPEEKRRLFEVFARALPELERALAPTLRGEVELELAELSEVSSDALFAGLEPPFAVVRFDVSREPGWAVWEIGAAVAAVEAAFGATEVKPASRRLSTIEKSMLKRLLALTVQRLAKLVSLEATQFRVVDAIEELGSWRDGGGGADAQRLGVHLALSGPGGDSTLRVYLPGCSKKHDPRRAEMPAKAPEHLSSVPFEIAARLGSADIALVDLLGLEVGDVIPLGAACDEPLQIVVEDRPCAEAHLGSKDGNLAVRIARLRPAGREE